MFFFLGLAAAAGWGTGDFLGTMASKRANVYVNACIAELVGLLAILPIAFAVNGSATTTDFAWSAAAGTVGSLSLAGLFTLLRDGNMRVLAPFVGVVAAGGASAFGIVTGDRPSSLALVGLLFALVAIGLLSIEENDDGSTTRLPNSHLLTALILGMGFAFYDIFLSRVPESAGVLPFAAARIAGFFASAGLVLVTGASRKMPRSSFLLAATGGVCDGIGGVAFLAGVQRGLLSLIAPIAAFYPIITVLCSVVIFRSRLTALQIAGILFAILSLPLLAVG